MPTESGADPSMAHILVRVCRAPIPRPRVLAATALAALLVGGCSLGDDEKPKPAPTGAPRQVAGVVTRLQDAAGRGDYRAVCDDLFTAAARRRAGGSGCAGELGRRAGELADPRIDIVGLDLQTGGATVKVRTRARGEPPATDTLKLVRQRGRYLIDSLGG